MPVKKLAIVIMGGGPAGVFTACGLRGIGYDVTLIARSRPFTAWEGLSERSYQNLRHFGFTHTVSAIGPSVIRESHWNGKSQFQNREYILNRQTFDQALLTDAETKGVNVISGRIDATRHLHQGWEVAYVTENGSETLRADFLIEARGREAKLGRKNAGGENRFQTAPPTTALLKSYKISPDKKAMTAIASFTKGWAWHVRDGQGQAVLQLFLSSEKGQLPPKAQLNDFFAKQVAEIPEAKIWLEAAQPVNAQVSVRAAAANCTAPVGGDDFLVVGDGSMALDPLSGNGIFYALGSGLAAVPVINSLLQKPSDRDLALSFFRDRIEHTFKNACLMGREFYEMEQRWPEEPFWQRRSHWPKGQANSHPDPLSQPAEIKIRPVVKDGFIVREQVIVTADNPRGVWKLDDVPLTGLLELLQSGAYDDAENAQKLGARPEQVTTARKWLLARGLINKEIGS